MVRRTDRPLQQSARIIEQQGRRQHLIEAYARLVPMVRRTSLPTQRSDTCPPKVKVVTMTARGGDRVIANDTVALYARVSSRNSRVTTRLSVKSRRSASVSLPTASSLNLIMPTSMRASGAIMFDRHWSGYAMRSLAARSSASMSMRRTGWPAVTPIKCS